MVIIGIGDGGVRDMEEWAIVGLSGIRTLIVGVEGEHADQRKIQQEEEQQLK